MKIGFIGIGVMGSRMVARLIAGRHQVTVYNRSPEKMKPLIALGASRAEDIASLAKQSDVICTCLSMPQDSLDVYLGETGILSQAQPNVICLDFTTVGADTSRAIFAKAKEKGMSYLDAPVSGGPEGAEQGTLTMMVGGEQRAFEQVKPLFAILGETIQYLGPSGAGSVAKLINQYLVAVHSVAASEAMVTGAAHGLGAEQLYQILKVSYGDSRMLRRHMEEYVLDRSFSPGGAVKYVHKDVKLANQLVSQAGLNRFLGNLAEQSFSEAIDQGFADYDMSAVILPLEKETQTIVKKMK